MSDSPLRAPRLLASLLLLVAVAAAPSRAGVVQLDASALFNADVVVNDGSGTNDPTQDPIDQGLVASGNFCFPTQSVSVANATAPATPDGLPDDGFFPAAGFHPDVQLAVDNDDDGLNAFRILDAMARLVVPVPPGPYLEAHVYATAGNGPCDISLTPIYSDGMGAPVPHAVPDWFAEIVESADEYYLIDGVDRIQPGSGPGTPFLYEDADDAAIFGFRLPTDPGRQLQSLMIERTDVTGVLNLFGAVAISDDPPEACCFEDGSCSDLSPGECSAADGRSYGPGSDCVGTLCPMPMLEACCFGDGTCADLLPTDCTAMAGLPQGPGSDCAGTPCPMPMPEACCFGDGTCADLLPTDCTAMAGLPQGPGSDCAGTLCPTAEACCFGDGTCMDLTAADCAAMGGLPQGPGTDCLTVDCSIEEACCLDDGSCLDLSPADCALMSGRPQGPGTDCLTADCSIDEACCFADGSCADLAPVDCRAMGGDPQGAGSDCAGTLCRSPEACCFGDGTCMDLTAGDCATMGGVPQGPGTDCLTADCSVLEACCFADGSCTDLSVTDCEAMAGIPQGLGTDCLGSICLRDEACCFPDGSCMDLAAADCATMGGLPQGVGTDCAGTVCPVPGLPGWAPDGADRPGDPLRVSKAAAGELDLAWGAGCSAEAIDNVVYEGGIGAWYDHEALLCDTGGALLSATITPGAGGRYYLIVPVTATDEGSYGLDSMGVERPAAAVSACRAARVLGCP